MKRVLFSFLAVSATGVWAASVERIIKPARETRGNTAIMRVQAIDDAAWITHPDVARENGSVAAPRVVRFQCAFTSDGTPLAFDVTGDERYALMLDGQLISRGPHRGTVENWMYQSYRAALTPGDHLLEAVVWKLPDGQAPLAQLSYRHGFCLKAEGAYDARLTTGRGSWRCGLVEGMASLGRSGGAWGGGDGFSLHGTGFLEASPATPWVAAVTIRPPLKEGAYGLVQKGWRLYPSQLPDQMAQRVQPGRFVEGGEKRFPLVVKPGEKRRILWDLGRYICAYPEAVVKGGQGGKMTWKWTESLRGPSKDPRFKGTRFKENRNEWQGKTFDGFGDEFVFDGRERAVFQPPWFRCGRWCELVIEAGAHPVEIQDVSLVETRYPLTCDTRFVTPDDVSLADIQAICVRAMQMCCHEMLFDCPYYEQQMYPGDTRVQLNVISAMTADDAMIRRAIEIYDLNRGNDGFVPFNYPTTLLQEGAAYTLCYLLMYEDYMRHHTNRAWLRARLPGMRHSLDAFSLYERADGLLENLPGWSFMDWVPGWRNGWAPGSRDGGANAELNLFYLAALQACARVEEAMGQPHLAAHWRAKADRLKPALIKTFFNDARGLFASDAAQRVYAEHAQCLALLTDVLEPARANALFHRLITEKDLGRTTVYFSYYLFETYFKFGRADLFLKRLDLWRGYLALGATTTLESPEFPGRYARSDCHAWGAHPVWFLRTGVAGIRSDAPFFARVRVAPQPGDLKKLTASYPHPSGRMIEVDLSFEGAHGVRGHVQTPVAGVFTYGGKTVMLTPGMNRIP